MQIRLQDEEHPRAPVTYSLTLLPLSCILSTASFMRPTIVAFNPLLVQLFKKPWCTNGRVPRQSSPRHGGCVAYHACHTRTVLVRIQTLRPSFSHSKHGEEGLYLSLLFLLDVLLLLL